MFRLPRRLSSDPRSRVPMPFVVVFPLVSVACAADPSGPNATRDAVSAPDSGVVVDTVEIVHGVPDKGRDPAVVALDIGGKGLCSGTLIAPDAVLTARHCVSVSVESVDCPPKGPQVLGDRDPRSIRVFAGDDLVGGRLVAAGRSIVSPPGPHLCDSDVALLFLDRPVEGIEPLGVRSTGVARGDTVRAVGFGKSGDAGDAGRKLLREHVRVLDTSTREFTVGEATCQGDSGGPALDEDTGEIVGVVSRGGSTCEGRSAFNVYTRADAFLEFIDTALGFLRLPDDAVSDAGILDGSAKDGGKTKAKADAGTSRTKKTKKPKSDVGSACQTGADCAAGLCVIETNRQYCSRSCGPGDRCPTGYGCAKMPDGTTVCLAK
ncbi:MAG: trypsin-like serine protease [Polyangiaceae bacterium]